MGTAQKQSGAGDARAVFREVKGHSDLVRYIEQCTGTTARQVGESVRFNPCPLCGHKDCFTVFGQDRAAFKCHSCEAGGDVFTFAEQYHHMSKGEALRAVAQAFGVDVPEAGDGADKRGAQANPLHDVLEAAVAHYREALKDRPESLAFLTAAKPDGRGHTERTIAALEVGYADGRLHEALQRRGISLDRIKQSGLYVERKKEQANGGQWTDFFCAGVFVFPHRTETGEMGHFTIKDPRKRVDYQLKTEHRLSGLHWGNQRAIEHETVHLVEGENDLASFFDAGVRNVMATLGQLTEKQIQWLVGRAGKKRFVLWFDHDTQYGEKGQPPAGVKYTRKLYNHLLRADCHVAVASALMEPGQDPDDWIQQDLETAPRRIQAAAKKAHHPLLWELRVMPGDVREDASATLGWLEELDYFELLGLVPDLQRDAIILELQKLGFSREAVLENIKAGYGLREMLQELEEHWQPGARPTETYMRAVAGRIWSYFKDRGKFFVSGDDSLHLFYQHRLYQIGANTPWEALLHKEAGLNITTQLTKYVVSEIKSLCFNRGDRLEAYSWVHALDEGAGPVVYLNLKDPANRILKLSPGDAELLENGTNPHAVLLAESTQMRSFTFDPEVNVAAGMRHLKDLVFDTLTCEPAQRYLLLAWTLSAYLMPLSQTRALMKMEGGTASGKTTAARLCSLLLYGDDMVGRSTVAGDYSMGSTEPLIIKDNLETDDINRAAMNFLLLAATGARNIKRKGGTESSVTAERLNCLVAITAIEPFAKPELINRTYIVEFSPRYKRMDFGENATTSKLVARRPEILSAWIQIMADKVLPDIEERERVIKYIREQHKHFTKDRTTELMALLTLITRALLEYIPLPESLPAGGREPEFVVLDEWIRYQDERAKLSEQGTNAVLQLLEGLRRTFLIEFSRNAEAIDDEIWCPLMGTKVHRQAIREEDGTPTGRQVYSFEASTSDLLAMFQRYGREYGFKVPFQNSRQLGVRLSNELSTLEASGWSASRVKVVHGSRIALFSWRDA